MFIFSASQTRQLAAVGIVTVTETVVRNLLHSQNVTVVHHR